MSIPVMQLNKLDEDLPLICVQHSLLAESCRLEDKTSLELSVGSDFSTPIRFYFKRLLPVNNFQNIGSHSTSIKSAIMPNI